MLSTVCCLSPHNPHIKTTVTSRGVSAFRRNGLDTKSTLLYLGNVLNLGPGPKIENNKWQKCYIMPCHHYRLKEMETPVVPSCAWLHKVPNPVSGWCVGTVISTLNSVTKCPENDTSVSPLPRGPLLRDLTKMPPNNSHTSGEIIYQWEWPSIIISINLLLKPHSASPAL